MTKHMYFLMDGRWYHSENCWCDEADREDLRVSMGGSSEYVYRWIDHDPPDCGWFVEKQKYDIEVTVRHTQIIHSTVTATSREEAKREARESAMKTPMVGENRRIVGIRSKKVKE